MPFDSRRTNVCAALKPVPKVRRMDASVAARASASSSAVGPSAIIRAISSRASCTAKGTDAFFVWNDEPLPLVDLAPRLGLESSPGEDPRGAALLLEVDGFQLALQVDRVVAEVEVFVRDLPRALAEHAFLGGVAVLPDGAPVFLLEPAGLVEELL